MGSVGSQTMSLGQILRNSRLHSGGQICDPILMQLDQNFCLSNILDKIEYGFCRVKPGHQVKF